MLFCNTRLIITLNFAVLILINIRKIVYALNEDEVENSDDYDYYDEDSYVDEEEFEIETPIYSNGFIKGTYQVNNIISSLSSQDYLSNISKNYGCLRRNESMVAVSDSIDNKSNISCNIENNILNSISTDEVNLFNISDECRNITNDDNITNNSKKKLNFREIQEIKLKQQRDAKELRERKKPKYLLGSNCETLICGSCKIIIEEFSKQVVLAINNIQIQMINQLIPNFCNSRELLARYDDLVSDICFTIFNNENYVNILLKQLDNENDWNNLIKPEKLFENQKYICSKIGACDSNAFSITLTPRNKYEDHWDLKCFICQAFAYNLEERVQLSRYLTEKTIMPVTLKTCEKLNLDKDYNEICVDMINSKIVDDIAWLAKVNDESTDKKMKSEKKFGDALCEQIKYCEKYLDPEEVMQMEAEEEIEVMLF